MERSRLQGTEAGVGTEAGAEVDVVVAVVVAATAAAVVVVVAVVVGYEVVVDARAAKILSDGAAARAKETPRRGEVAHTEAFGKCLDVVECVEWQEAVEALCGWC